MLAAGALALAVTAPVLESVHIPAEARPPVAAPATVVTAALEARAHAPVASRAAARRSATRPAATAARAAQRQIFTVRRAEESRAQAERQLLAQRRVLAQRRAALAQRRAVLAQRRAAALALAERRAVARAERARPARHVVGQRAKPRARRGAPAGMASVIAFAQSQVGKRYSAGAEGPHAFDCSGFTKRAYALAGIRLPHSSGAQAARARTIPRSAARPGDLVVGRGHVGIYMGRGMMIDAGNRRTGVVYRKMYAGLHIERF